MPSSKKAEPPDLISRGLSPKTAKWLRDQMPQNKKRRTQRDILAEYFIRGVEVGADDPELAGDGRAMYEAFKEYYNG